MKKKSLSELSAQFFAVRQIIRAQVPGGPDPNAWMRSEVLRFIGDAGSKNMQEIAEYLHVRAPSATSLVANLEKAGLVARATNESDKRVVHISLTAEGKHALGEYCNSAAETMKKVFSKLEEKDIEELSRILRRVQEMHR